MNYQLNKIYQTLRRKVFGGIYVLIIILLVFTGYRATLPVVKAGAMVTVTLHFMDIKSASGCLQYGIYTNEEEFRNEKPIKLHKVAKTALKDGKLIAALQLPAGIYGISILDDENFNGLMDYNFVGMPREGFAFSNYYHSGLSRPKFQQFKFEVRSETLHLDCKFRYI